MRNTATRKRTENHKGKYARNVLFLAYYLDPKSETFSNMRGSAIRAGFSKTYASNLTTLMPAWLEQTLAERGMLDKAEQNLNKVLDLETKEQVVTMIGPLVDKTTGAPIVKENPRLLKIQADVSQFVAERLNRKKYGNTEPPPGNTTNNFLIFSPEQSERIARRILASGEPSEKKPD